MLKRIGAIVGMAAVVAVIISDLRGSHSGGAARPSPSATASASASPTLAGADLVAAMETSMAQPRAWRITFSGVDRSGRLSFDVITDGHGGLRGSYVRQGYAADIVVTDHDTYMRGSQAIALYTGIPVAGTVTQWVDLPNVEFNPGVLASLASATKLAQCIGDSAGAVSSWQTYELPGQHAANVAPQDLGVTQPWLFRISQTGTPVLLAWQLSFSVGSEPASCNNGIDEPGGLRTGPVGTFTFAGIATTQLPATVVAPTGAIPLPDSDPANHPPTP